MHTFSVILVLVVVFAGVLGVRAVSRARAVRRQGYALEPLPSQIYAEIQAIPVMQQPRAIKGYYGLGVRWQVTFESAIVLGPVSIRLMCQDRGNYPWVLCDVHKRQYPQLNTLVKHAPLWVSGQISKIEGDEFILKNARLEFDS